MTTTDPTAPSTAPQPAPLDLDAITARREQAYEHVVDLCQGKHQWRMSIPARPDRDDDLVISATLDDVDRLVAEVRRQRAELDAAPAAPRTYQLPAEPGPEVTELWTASGLHATRCGKHVLCWVLAPGSPLSHYSFMEMLTYDGPLLSVPPAGTEAQ